MRNPYMKFQNPSMHGSWTDGRTDTQTNNLKPICPVNFFEVGGIIKGQISSSSLIPVFAIHLPTVHVCTKFQPSKLTVPEKSVTKNFNVWKLERKKNEEIKGWICRSSLIPVYTIHLPTVHVCTKFQPSRLTVPEKSVMKNFNVWKLERKKNEEIKGWISRSSLIPVHTIHLSTVHVCTKFQCSRPHSSWEKCDEKFHLKGYGMTESQSDRMY